MLALKQIYQFRQGKVSARRYARDQAKLRNRLDKGFQKKVDGVFNKAVRVVASQVKQGEDPSYSSITRMISEELDAVLKAQVRRTFDSVYAYNNDRYSKLAQKSEGFSFGRSDEFERSVNIYFKGRQPMFAGISRSYGESILSEVSFLRGEDQTLDQIARSLTKTFSPINRKRAAVIARTETHSAQSFANDEYHRRVSDSFGVQMVKQWVSTADSRTRSTHSAMNGETAQMDEDFFMPDGSRMAYAGDPKGGAKNVINCRCVILYVDQGDDIEDTEAPSRGDAPVLEREARAGSDGLPIGLNDSEIAAQIKAGTLDFKQARKSLKSSISAGADNDLYGAAKGEARYRGSKVTDYGKDAVSKYFAGEEAGERAYIVMDQVSKELGILAALFKIPEIRGYKKIRKGSRAGANMGDGVMGINVDYFKDSLTKKNEKRSFWQQGQRKSEKPYVTDSYWTESSDRIRAIMYHEFGHHIHQIKGIEKSSSYTIGKWETFIRDRAMHRSRSSPSKYGDTMAVEWFAENFSAWAMRRKDLVDPEFLILIEDILKDG